ncbi:hsp90 co-chaperone Cdc37-like 1 [Patagioenas fasciata]|uniref:hsp90 co-chaperone Cdc37-like 1 n=1 Tax=Patagioenas fasciata TaxID=372321 RepID=UPI003A99F7BD
MTWKDGEGQMMDELAGQLRQYEENLSCSLVSAVEELSRKVHQLKEDTPYLYRPVSQLLGVNVLLLNRGQRGYTPQATLWFYLRDHGEDMRRWDGKSTSTLEAWRKDIEDEDISKSFIQKHEQKIRYFGMLGRWDDSQRFLSDHPYLVCKETAKYLILWCFHLEAKQKRALMEQIAHQAVVMQFIIEMARSCNVDPRGCFRLFFKKAKAGEEGYLEAFKTELEAFKSRVRICSQSQGFQAMSVQNPSVYTGILSILHLLRNANDLQGYVNRSVCNLNSVLQKDEEPKMMDTV